MAICLQVELEGTSKRVSALRVPRRRSNDPVTVTTEEPRGLPSLSLPHEQASGSAQAQAEKPTFRTTAVDRAATAAAAAPTSSLQQWEGNNLVARVPAAARNSMMQAWAQSGLACKMGDDTAQGSEAGMQLGRVGGSKLSRKRSAEVTEAQPAAKRWQSKGSVAGGDSKRKSLWEIASAAKGLQGGSGGMEAAQGKVEIGVAEGNMALNHKRTSMKASFSSAVMEMDDQYADQMDEQYD